MKKILKKNQIMITAVAIMIAIAGYLNFAGDKIGEENLLSSEKELTDASDGTDGVYAVNVTDADMDENNLAEATEDIYSLDEDIPGDAIFTNGTSVSNLASAKLIKEQSRAKSKDALLEIINNENVTEDNKKNAINSMVALTNKAEMESAAEVLLEAKGFTNVVVSLNEEQDSADVIVAADSLTDAQTAQIMDIVQRKTEIAPEHIIITMAKAE